MKNFPARRMLDLLVIVAIACGLLGLAWQVARERGNIKEHPPGSLLAEMTPSASQIPELQQLLPLEKFGMVLTRETIQGSPEQALADLDRRCQEILATADEWVLSLAISPEEQQLLDSLDGTEPLPEYKVASSVVVRSAEERSVAERKGTLAQLYPLTQPTGRAGIRWMMLQDGPLTPALSPPVESMPKVESSTGESEQARNGTFDSGAALGRRLICWGFILSSGADVQTVWFAKPREKLPRSASREGHTP